MKVKFKAVALKKVGEEKSHANLLDNEHYFKGFVQGAKEAFIHRFAEKGLRVVRVLKEQVKDTNDGKEVVFVMEVK